MKTEAIETERITPTEAAKILRISNSTLWRQTSPRGPIQCIRVGSVVRYDRAYIENYGKESDTSKA